LVRIFEAGILFGVARNAAKSITATPQQGSQQAALISIVFSVLALEAFLNEAIELANDFTTKATPNIEPEAVTAFIECMADAERSHASLESKFVIGNWVLTGRRLDRGAFPYQDLLLLISLRNDLVHFKPSEGSDSAIPVQSRLRKRLEDKFRTKNILANDRANDMSWVALVETKAVADWSCATAAQIVTDFVAKIPKSQLRTVLGLVQGGFEN
jgi:hypothetical protein